MTFPARQPISNAMLSAATAKRIGRQLLGMAVGSTLAFFALLGITLTLWAVRDALFAPPEFTGPTRDLGLFAKLCLAAAVMTLPTLLVGGLVVLWLRIRRR